jgi:acetoin utilization deacetylase AcuC-like enzyme
VALAHKKEYIEIVKKDAESGAKQLSTGHTLLSKESYDVALWAVGGVLAACDAVMEGKTRNAFCAVRPPGHHAMRDKGMGFCIFNNISIATQKLVKEGKKVLIFDFDGHLGDGTEKFFYDTNEVLYWSIHQYPAFPGNGWVDEFGEGKGKGYTINVPLPPGSADDLYLDAINRFIPIAKQFNPDAVAISAGFDGYQHDLLLELKLTTNTYYKLGGLVRKNFKNFFATLEGGYNTKILPHCVYNFLDGINNKKQRFKEEETISSKEVKKEYEKRIKELEKNLSKYWKI